MANLYEITREALDLAQILETEELTPALEQALILNQQQLQTKAGGYAKIIANYQYFWKFFYVFCLKNKKHNNFWDLIRNFK